MTTRLGCVEVDGTLVLSGDPSEAVHGAYGAIIVRCGHSDESLTRRGISHLIEHLALVPQDRRAVLVDGYVDLTTTVLRCRAATLAEVGTFLTSVTRALADLPLERMEHEARVLRAEAAAQPASALGTALGLRFGPTGFGTSGHEELFLHQPSAKLVERHRGRFFTRGNAAVVLSGPVPATLDLSALPDGAHVPVRISLPVEQQFPAWAGTDGNAVSMTCVLPRSPAVAAAMYVATAALGVALRGLAGTDDILLSTQVLSSTHAHHQLQVGCRPTDGSEVMARMQTELRRIAYDGCTPELLAEYQQVRLGHAAQPGASLAAAHLLASEALYGNLAVDLDARAAAADALTVADVQQVAHEALEGALWLVPQTVPVVDRRLHPVTRWSSWEVRGQPFQHVRPGSNRDTLIASYEGVSLSVPGEGQISISFDRIVACKAWADGARTLYGSDGSTLGVHPADWVGGDDVIALIDRHVARDQVVATSDRMHAA